MQSSRIDNSRIMNFTHKPRRNGNGNGNGQYLGPKPITAEEAAKTVYVSNLTNDIAQEAIIEAFSHYGHVENIVRRCVNFELNAGSGQQYAFIKFVHAKDAQFVINLGDITVQGRKLTVRPRDKPGSPRGRDYRQDEQSTKRIIDMLHNSARSVSQGSPPGLDGRPTTSRASEASQPISIPTSRALRPITTDASSTFSPPQSQLSSRILMVANVPIDMTPHEFFELFGQYGLIERAYIFPHADGHGRRFRQVIMFSPFYARKAFEALHGAFIRGPLPLDISFYTQSIPTYPPPVAQPPTNGALSHYPINGSMFPPVDFGGMGVQLPPVHGAPPAMNYPPQWNEQMMLPIPQGHIVPIPGHSSYPAQPALQHYPSKEHLATQGGWSMSQMAQPFVNQFQPEFGHGQLVYDAPEALATADMRQAGSRCFSGSSTATLVGNIDRSIKKMAYEDGYSEGSPRLAAVPMEHNHQSHAQKDVPELQEPQEGRSVALNDNVPTITETTIVTEEVEAQVIPETPRPYDPANLHVKNLDDSRITNTEDLKNLFAGYGQIASAVLVAYPNSGISKGFGFVAFTTPADAAKAKANLNGLLVGRKPIVINYAERKEDRRQRLKAIFDSRTGSKPASDVCFSPDVAASEHLPGESVPTITISGISDPETAFELNISEEEQKKRTEPKSDSSPSERAGLNEASPTGKDASHSRNAVDSPVSDSTLDDSTETPEEITSLINAGQRRGPGAVIRSIGTEPRLQNPPLQTEQRFTVTTTVTTTKAWHGGRITQLEDDNDDNKPRPAIPQSRKGSYHEHYDRKTVAQTRPKASSYSKSTPPKNIEVHQPSAEFGSAIGLPSPYATGPTTIQLGSHQSSVPQLSPSQNPQKPTHPAAGLSGQRGPLEFGDRMKPQGIDEGFIQQRNEQQHHNVHPQAQAFYSGNMVQSYGQRIDGNVNMDPNASFGSSQRGRKWRPSSGGFRRRPDYNQMRPIVEEQQWNNDPKKPKRKKSYTRQQGGNYYGEGSYDPLPVQYNERQATADMGEHVGKPVVPIIKVEVPQ